MKRISLAAALAWLAVFVTGCSKSKSPEPPATLSQPVSTQTDIVTQQQSKPQATQPSPLTNVPPARATNAAPSGAVATPEQIQRIATLEKNYAAATAFDDRFDVLLEIGQAGTGEGVKALERLFRTEKDSALREELINALISIGGCKEEKLEFLRLGTAAQQPSAVREAAIDGLVDLVDERALALLRNLCNDPDEKLRTLARSSCELAEAMLKAQ